MQVEVRELRTGRSVQNPDKASGWFKGKPRPPKVAICSRLLSKAARPEIGSAAASVHRKRCRVGAGQVTILGTVRSSKHSHYTANTRPTKGGPPMRRLLFISLA